MIKVTDCTFEAWQATMAEAEKLAAKPNSTPAEIRMHAVLLQKAAGISKMMLPSNATNAQLIHLKRQVGMRDDQVVPSVSSPAEIRALRNWVIGDEETFEFRSDAPSQASSMWGRVSGQTFIGGDLLGGTTSGIAGGYTVPSYYYTRDGLFTSLANVDQIVDSTLGYSRLVTSDKNGAAMPIPMVDDLIYTGSPAVGTFVRSYIVGQAVAENTGTDNQSFAAVSTIFPSCPKFRTSVGVALELIGGENLGAGDAFANFMDLFFIVASQRHAAALGYYFINGLGASSGQPLGLLTAAKTIVSSNQFTTASSSAISLPDLHSLFSSLSAAYRRNCVVYCNSSTWEGISALLESTTRNSVNDYELFHRPVAICDSMPNFGAAYLALSSLQTPDTSYRGVLLVEQATSCRGQPNDS